MTVPTLKQQMVTDRASSYGADMPWVEMATTDNVSGAFPVRRVLQNPDFTGQDKEYQHQMIFIRVLKTSWPSPVYGEIVTFAGQGWRVEQIAHAGEAEWSIVVNREVRPLF